MPKEMGYPKGKSEAKPVKAAAPASKPVKKAQRGK
jgi:hypothetical protein